MDTATRMTNVGWVLDREAGHSWGGIRVELGHALMKRLRRAAISLLDMRTEFEVVASDVTAPIEGPVGLTIMGWSRRVASKLLDPWTEFVVLD